LKLRILELHPYEVPEVLAVPVEAGYQPYLDWLAGGAKERSLLLEERLQIGQRLGARVLFLGGRRALPEDEEVAVVGRVLVVRRLGLGLAAAVPRRLVVRGAVAAGVQGRPAVRALVAAARRPAQ